MTTTPQQDHFRMCQVIGSLKLEVNTGMRHSRGSILRLAQQEYKVKAKTKKGALKEMLDKYKEKYGREYGS